VSGTALLYTLNKFTNIKSIALIEKYEKPGLVNSKSTNNSQTLHSGDIETNYTFEKAKKVKRKADMLKWYLEEVKKNNPGEQFFSVYNKMILAVGETEVNKLEERWTQFQTLYPTLKRLKAAQIAEVEPLVMERRNPHEKVLALSSPEGYTIDYGALSQNFVAETMENKKDKTIDLMYNTLIEKVTKTTEGYSVLTSSGEMIDCKVLIVSAGGHTPLIAQSLGYAKNYSILSVAGTFFKSTKKLLNGKVYTMQMEKLPFAAVHGDPDVYNADETRFGPTAKGIFMLERYNYKSIWEYFQVFGFRWRAFKIIFQLATDKII
jgi:malate dehydrogenase (quinone)